MAIVLIIFLIAASLTKWFTSTCSPFSILDYPNERSLHNKPKPRTGGIAVVLAILLGILLVEIIDYFAPSLLWLLGSSLLVTAISFVDDLSHVSAVFRWIIHLFAATLFLYGGFLPEEICFPGFHWTRSDFISLIFCLLFLVWMVNLYNFMDGMDGFAGGMTCFGFTGYAILGFVQGNQLFGLLSLIVISATAGFLLFNFPPSRIFMGDVGASTLGFLAAAFALWAQKDGLIPLWISILLFSPFIVDATWTLFRRMIRRERVWEAHRSHFYQRLVLIGWSHRRTVLWEYVLMGLCLISGILALCVTSIQFVLPFLWILIYLLIIRYINKLEMKLEQERI